MRHRLRGKSPTVTTEKTFTVDPWCLREPELDLDVLPSTEAVLTIANGNLGVRGTLDEGEPVGHPGPTWPACTSCARWSTRRPATATPKRPRRW